MRLICGDCLEEMDKLIAGGVVVDAIICDPPFGTTACKWDSVIPFDKMWERLNQLIKDNGAIVLFGSEPFSSKLRCSNLKNYKYDWVYKKRCSSNFGTMRFQPAKEHENILIFSKKTANYYPVMQDRVGTGAERVNYKVNPSTHHDNNIYGNLKKKETTIYTKKRHPSSVQEFNNRAKGDRGLHPTQKPVALMEYLIKTYTNEGELVLDFTMGSGTTGVACKKLGRKFIGIEMDDKYFEIAKKRIEDTLVKKGLFDE